MFASLCFLSYQRPEFLKKAIGTALKYAEEPVELIVHDDGSSDPAVHSLLYALHAQGLASLVMIGGPGVNRGQGVALNRMFRAASGDPIIKLDQDLVFKPGWLPRVREILEDPAVGLCGLFKYEHEPVDWRKTIVTDLEIHRRGWEGTPVGHSYHTHICGSGFAVPRKVWDTLGPFEEGWESFGEDWEFQKAVYAAGKFCALPDEDVVSNVGFGLGPSTVVIRDANGQPTVRAIHKAPKLVKGRA